MHGQVEAAGGEQQLQDVPKLRAQKQTLESLCRTLQDESRQLKVQLQTGTFLAAAHTAQTTLECTPPADAADEAQPLGETNSQTGGDNGDADGDAPGIQSVGAPLCAGAGQLAAGSHPSSLQAET